MSATRNGFTSLLPFVLHFKVPLALLAENGFFTGPLHSGTSAAGRHISCVTAGGDLKATGLANWAFRSWLIVPRHDANKGPSTIGQLQREFKIYCRCPFKFYASAASTYIRRRTCSAVVGTNISMPTWRGCFFATRFQERSLMILLPVVRSLTCLKNEALWSFDPSVTKTLA